MVRLSLSLLLSALLHAELRCSSSAAEPTLPPACGAKLDAFCANESSWPEGKECYDSLRKDKVKLPCIAIYEPSLLRADSVWRCVTPDDVANPGAPLFQRTFASGSDYCSVANATMASVMLECCPDCRLPPAPPSPPPPPPPTPPAPPSGFLLSVFNSSVPGPGVQKPGSAIWAIPSLVYIPPASGSGVGSLLAVAEAREASLSDDAPCTLGLRRSTDGGLSWGGVSFPYRGWDPKQKWAQPQLLFDAVIRTVFLMFSNITLEPGVCGCACECVRVCVCS